jgi:hypothetical protein
MLVDKPKPIKHRLIIDFESIEAIREFAEVMADRTPLPRDAVIREWETADGNVRARKYVWALRDEGVDDNTIWPELSPELEARGLRERLAQLEAK